MDEITMMLDNWRNLAYADNVFEKDYFIENDYVTMTISVTVESGFLFKTLKAKCHLVKQEIENAINKLDEKKDELI